VGPHDHQVGAALVGVLADGPGGGAAGDGSLDGQSRLLAALGHLVDGVFAPFLEVLDHRIRGGELGLGGERAGVDDAEHPDGGPAGVGDGDRVVDGRFGRTAAVGRDQHPVDLAAVCLLVGPGGQHGCLRPPEDVFGHAPDDIPADPGPAVGPHGQEVDVVLGRVVEDLLAGLAAADRRLRGVDELAGLLGPLLALALEALDDLLLDAAGVEGDGDAADVGHREDVDVGVEPVGKRPHVLGRPSGVVAAVRREQYPFVHA
jgi:hypothetical protein